MKILILHTGQIKETILLSSIFEGLNKKYKDPQIICIVKEETLNFYKFYKKYKINFINTIDMLSDEIVKNNFDLFIDLTSNINFHPFSQAIAENISFENKINLENKENLYYLKSLFFECGMKWRGEGYFNGYIPKTKSKNNRIGLAVANKNLINYILDNMLFDKMRKWIIPFKQNIFKKTDEINRCGTIVTDDLLTLRIAISLKKYCYYLDQFNNNKKIEFFGKGTKIDVPKEIFQ